MSGKNPVVKIAACRRAVEIVRDSLTNPKLPTNNNPPFILNKYFKVRQVKSAIGLPKTMKKLILSLGIKRLFKAVYVPVTRAYVGSLTRARHLVEIDLVDDLPPANVPKNRGYEIVGNWLQMSKADQELKH